MSGRRWQWPLQEDEALIWQGRPAPRCYTFRNWKLALAGTALFLASSFWMMLAVQLVKTDAYSPLLVVITLPFVAATFCMGPGHLLLSRWRWEKLFYALTDRHLLVRDGLLTARIRSYPRHQISGWQQRRFGDALASIRILRGDEAPLILACLEQPQGLLQHLPQQTQPADAGVSV